jgi:hypothetical protein
MTRFTVVWVQSAQDSLARLYLEAPNPKAATDAAIIIDPLLATNPIDNGTHIQ